MKTTQLFLASILIVFSVSTISAQYGNYGYGNNRYGGSGYGRNSGMGQMNQGSQQEKPKEIPVEETVAKVMDEMKPALNLDELQVIAISNVLIESMRTQGILFKQVTNQEDQVKEFQALSETTDRKIKEDRKKPLKSKSKRKQKNENN